MKRIISSILAGLFLTAAPMVQARNLSADEARDAAMHYLQHNTFLERTTANDLVLAHQWTNPTSGEPSMYLFNHTGNGFIIMAATTAMDPIVAYSDNRQLDVERMGESLSWWLDKYNTMVCEVQDYDAAQRSSLVCSEWEALEHHALKGNTKDTRIILMEEEWDQGNNAGTTYNMYSPVVNDTTCPTGCVATALAQICHYYGYPLKAKGTVTASASDGTTLKIRKMQDSAAFNYAIMENHINYNTPIESRREMSRLAYYIGVTVGMSYAPQGSGAVSYTAIGNMNTNFKYQKGSMTYRSTVADSVYLQRLRNELMMNRPCYMGGSSKSGGVHAAGHAWVCCGYRTDNLKMYYMNWGWDGTGNAFYNLGNNNMPIPGMGYNFTEYQEIVTGLIPPQDSTSRDIYAAIPRAEGQVVLGHPYPNPATTSVMLPYSCNHSTLLAVYSIDGRQVATQTLQAGNDEVRLDVSAMPAGIYIYRAGDTYGKFVVR